MPTAPYPLLKQRAENREPPRPPGFYSRPRTLREMTADALTSFMPEDKKRFGQQKVQELMGEGRVGNPLSSPFDLQEAMQNKDIWGTLGNLPGPGNADVDSIVKIISAMAAAKLAEKAAFKGAGSTLNMFFGPRALGADKKTLKIAEELAKERRPIEEIYRESEGWYPGMGGGMRYESSDATSKFRKWPVVASLVQPQERSRLAEILDNPAVFENYPSLADLPVELIHERPNYQAALMRNRDTLAPTRIVLNRNMTDDPLEALSHEVQHVIQGEEGWDTGTSPQLMLHPTHPGRFMYDDLIKMYEQLPEWRQFTPEQRIVAAHRNAAHNFYEHNAGEVEANNAGITRLRMTPFERGIKPPWTTQQYPYDEQFLNPDPRQLGPKVPPK